MRPIAEAAFTVTVRTGLLWLIKSIADKLSVPRTMVLNEVQRVLAHDENLALDLSGDDSLSVDLR